MTTSWKSAPRWVRTVVVLGTVAVVGVVTLVVVVLHGFLGQSAHDLPFRKSTGPGSVVSARTGPTDLRPSSPDAAARLTAILEKWALPQHPASTPMLVLYGSADPLVAPASTTAAIARARLLGDQITADLQQGRGHTDLDMGAAPQWIDDRFK